jgi:hypothetical protein
MLGRLRRGTSYSSPNHGTSYYGAEKLALFGAMQLASNKCSPTEPCPNPTCRQHFCARRAEQASLASILPSIGRVPSATLPHTQTCENVRHPANHAQTTHHGLRADDLGTNRLSPGGLGVVADAPARSGERDASADRSWLGMSADAVSACGGFAENSALDQPRSRSSELTAGAARRPAAC